MKKILIIVIMFLITLNGVNAVPTMTSNIETIYNTSNISITLTNDWVSSTGINENLNLTNFDNITNIEEDNSFIQLIKQGFDISTAVYDSFLDTNAQLSSPQGVEFNSDGSKMFMVGNGNDNIVEFHCSVNFDLSTCSYDSYLDVSSQDTTPRGFTFNSDGSQVYMVGDTGNSIYEYHCSVNFDISTCSYDSLLDVSSTTVDPIEVKFNSDGSKMFSLDRVQDKILEFHCSVNFDISTCSYDSLLDVSSQDGSPWGMTFNPKGDKMYMVGQVGDNVYEYHCSVNFDISTCSYDSFLDVSSQDTTPNGLCFNSDGSEMYVLGYANMGVFQYNLDSDYLISGYLSKNYTSTSILNKFNLFDNRTLNGQSITSKLYFNGTEYNLNSSDLGLEIPDNSNFELRYYFTGTTTQTPQLSDINFKAINTNDPTLVEMFYSLNGASVISLGNTTNTTFELIGVEELNDINFSLNSNLGSSTLNETFNIDTTNPIINNNILSEYNSYSIVGFNSSCTDINLVFCNISLNSQNVALNTSSFTFSENGNISYTIIAEDLAGNTINEYGIILVNPTQYIYFNNVDASELITNFTIDSNLYSTVFDFNVYDYGLGNHTFTFSKDGFKSANFTIELNINSQINTTIDIVLARIIINLYNDNTKELITNNSFSLQLSGPAGYIFGSAGTLFNISDSIFAGTYTGLISSIDYESKEIFFTYTAQELKELDIYFIPLNLTNLGFVTIQAYKADNTPYKYISTYAKQWFAGESVYKKVQETKTGGDGTAELKIILEDYIYQFCIYTEETGETCTDDEIIKTTENGQVIPITEEKRITTQDSYSNLLDFTENIHLQVSNITGFRNLYVNFDWVDLSGFNLEMCYNIHKDFQYTKELVESDCIIGDVGTFEQIYLLNSSYAYIVGITATIDNIPLPMYYDTFKSAEPSESLEGVLESKSMGGLGLVLYIVVIMTIVALLKNPFHMVVIVFIAVLGANSLFSSLMSPSALSALITFCGMTAWGLRQLR